MVVQTWENDLNSSLNCLLQIMKSIFLYLEYYKIVKVSAIFSLPSSIQILQILSNWKYNYFIYLQLKI